MREPTALQWLFGNPVVNVMATLTVFAAFLGWLTGHVDGSAALLALIIAAPISRTAERVSAYRRWQREWNGMGGDGGGMKMPSWKVLHRGAAIIVWLVFAAWSLDAPADDPWMPVVVVLFWAGSAGMGLVLMVRLLGGGAPSRRRKSAVVVSVCLGKPIYSPAAQDAFQALPESRRPLYPSKASQP